jgi:hypothetical protein
MIGRRQGGFSGLVAGASIQAGASQARQAKPLAASQPRQAQSSQRRLPGGKALEIGASREIIRVSSVTIAEVAEWQTRQVEGLVTV